MAAPVIFNVAKGSINHYALSAGVGNAALIAVPIELAGLETNDVLIDYDTLAAILAASNNEQVTMGRKTILSATISVDDTANTRKSSISNIQWLSAAGNPVGALILCLDLDTTAGDDSAIIPIAKYDWVVTPVGTNITAIIDAAGIWGAS